MANSQEEHSRLEKLLGDRLFEIPARKTHLLEDLARGKFDAWHYIGHGRAMPDPYQNLLWLEDDDLNPLNLDDPRLAAAWRDRPPIIFVNSCHAAVAGDSGTRTVGIAQAFLRQNAGAFVGTNWTVPSSRALAFAEAFYERLLKGKALADAAWGARRKLLSDARGRAGDPTPFAYAIYAHPDAKVV